MITAIVCGGLSNIHSRFRVDGCHANHFGEEFADRVVFFRTRGKFGLEMFQPIIRGLLIVECGVNVVFLNPGDDHAHEFAVDFESYVTHMIINATSLAANKAIRITIVNVVTPTINIGTFMSPSLDQSSYQLAQSACDPPSFSISDRI